MKKLILILFAIVGIAAFAEAQTVRQAFAKDTVNTSWEKRALGDLGKDFYSLFIWNEGPGSLRFTLQRRDTAAISGNVARYFEIDAGEGWPFASVATDSVWMKAVSDSAIVRIFKW